LQGEFNLIGVSPAYFISRFTDEFTPSDVAHGLQEIADMGYRGFQLEVYHHKNLTLWRQGGCQKVRQRATGLGLTPTQFVAHFMMAAFATPADLLSDYGLAEMQAVLEIVNCFEACRIITLPLGSFDIAGIALSQDYRAFFNRCVDKIGRLLEMVEAAGYRLALEIMPAALIGGSDGFLRLCDQLATRSLGLNFDTGHARAAKENLYLIPAKLGRYIVGTHLCDNFGNENLSLRPGAGSIDWPKMITALKAAGYRGAFDIEIACPLEAVRQEYSQGRIFIETLLNKPDVGEATNSSGA
jgi:sugar phosphate isomerase/epimerase